MVFNPVRFFRCKRSLRMDIEDCLEFQLLTKIILQMYFYILPSPRRRTVAIRSKALLAHLEIGCIDMNLLITSQSIQSYCWIYLSCQVPKTMEELSILVRIIIFTSSLANCKALLEINNMR